MSEYCRIHNQDNCQQCMFDNLAKQLMTDNQRNTDKMVRALKPPINRKRRIDMPLMIAQVISIIVFVGFIVFQTTRGG